MKRPYMICMDLHVCVCVLNKTNINPIKVAGKFPYHLLRHDVEIPQMGQPDRSLALSTPHSIHSSYFGLEASESTKTSLKKCNSCKTATRDLKMSIKLENLENPLKKQIFPVALPEKKHGNYFHMFSKGICHKIWQDLMRWRMQNRRFTDPRNWPVELGARFS